MVQLHVYIEVSTPEAGIGFYCNGLGFLVRRQLSPRWIELAGAAVPVFLLCGRARVADLGSRTAERTYERHWTPVHLDVVIDDLDAVLARVLVLGASLDRGVGAREYGRIANMADPFGNGFDLIEFTSEAGYDGILRG